MFRGIRQKDASPDATTLRYTISCDVASWRRATLFSRFYDRRAQAEAPGRGRAPEPRDQLRVTEGDRAGARAWRPAGELGVQSGARAPAIRDVATLSSAAAALQALGRAGIRHPARPCRVRVPSYGPGPRHEETGDVRPDARRVHRGRRR